MPALDVLVTVECHSAAGARPGRHQAADPGSDDGQASAVSHDIDPPTVPGVG